MTVDLGQIVVQPSCAGAAEYPVFPALGSDQLTVGHRVVVGAVSVTGEREGALAPHVLQGRQPVGSRRLGKAGDRPFEDHGVVLVDGQRGPRLFLALKLFTDAKGTVRVDSPRQVDPELLLFPNFTRVGLVGPLEVVTLQFAVTPQDRLAEPNPASRVCFVAGQVVAFRGEAHGQHVVGKPR